MMCVLHGIYRTLPAVYGVYSFDPVTPTNDFCGLQHSYSVPSDLGWTISQERLH